MFKKHHNKQLFYIIISLTLFGVVAIINGYNVSRYAVDIPVWDEWETFNNPSSLLDFDILWILQQHNEHRIVFTKLISWIAFKLDNLNIRNIIILNYYLFLLIPISLMLIYYRHYGYRGLAGFIFICTFLLSNLPYENHLWAFQSQFHISILCVVWLSYWLALPITTHKQVMWIILLSTIAIFSFSNALPIIAGFFVIKNCFVLLKIFFDHENNTIKTFFKSKLMIVNLIALCIFLLYFVNYQFNKEHPFYTTPLTLQYWKYFSHLILHGIGLRGLSVEITFFVAALLFIGLIGLLITPKNIDSRNFLLSVFIISIPIISALIISYGRANLGIQQALSSRYTEYSLLLIPGIFILIINSGDKIRLPLGIYIVIITFCNISHFNYPQKYNPVFQERIKGVGCIRSFYEGENQGVCGMLYPAPISNHLTKAKNLRISFYLNWRTKTKTDKN